MPPEKPRELQQSQPLGDHLKLLREAAGFTLRHVEDLTEKQISNAYLSQLENNKIKKPDPNTLNLLSDVYHTDYGDLMRRAGYVATAPETANGKRQARAPTFAVKNLTPDEEKSLIEYLAFIRKQKR